MISTPALSTLFHNPITVVLSCRLYEFSLTLLFYSPCVCVCVCLCIPTHTHIRVGVCVYTYIVICSKCEHKARY